MFQYILVRSDRSPKSVKMWTSVTHKIQTLLKGLSRRSSVATSEELALIRDKLLDNEAETVYIGPSSVFNGGNGVFLNQSVRKGDLLTFYGGSHFPQPPISVSINDLATEEKVQTPKVDCSDYIMNLGGLGKGYIDGQDRVGDKVDAKSCGQIINHPPAGHRPNVEAVEFMWAAIIDMDEGESNLSEKDREHLWKEAHEINNLFEGLWYHDGAQYVSTPHKRNDKSYYNSLLAGIGMVAREDMSQGTELFLDYELNLATLNDETKDWYHPVPLDL